MKTKFLFSEDSETKTYKAGDVIFKQGEEGDSMYAVVEGEVDIILNDKIIHTLTKESIFGEMALINKEVRSATVVAKTDCKINEIDERRFIFLVQQNPYFALDVMSLLSKRIQNMNKILLA